MAKQSQHFPDERKPTTQGVAMFNSSKEAFDELWRRISVLGQTGYLYEGLAIRMSANSALTIQETAQTDPRFKNHKGYAGKIDVFDVPDGFHVSVDDSVEIAALRAELGSRTTRLQPLWGPAGRQAERDAINLGEKLAEFVSKQAEKGIALSDKDLDALVPFREPQDEPGLDVLRDIVAERKARMAQEER